MNPLKSIATGALAALLLNIGIVAVTGAESSVDPGRHSFPALGGITDPKVKIEWNRFYDHAGLSAILHRLHETFPDLTELYSIGQSVEGRELWLLEVTAKSKGEAKRKPAIYIQANIHGNEVQGGEATAYTAWYLCHQYGQLEKVTELLDRATFYLVPTINPDGRDHWLHNAHNAHSSRTGLKPHDDDRDGAVDEDGPDDLDGDGSITQMRVRDPNGRWKPHPDFPEQLMVRVADDENGEFTLLGWEGVDNDGDGRINEDSPGGYDMNRNWAFDWQPPYIQGGAHEYPFSLPETRAVAEFVIAHSNIAAFQSYHNFGGMILRSPGREGGAIRSSDDRTMQFIAERGEKILPYYDSMVVWKDLYTVWGGEVDWFYGARGILGFVNEIWNLGALNKAGRNSASQADQAAFLRYVLLNDGVTKWTPFEHPIYGMIEIGGTRKNWMRVPPSFLLEEECHRNMAFTLYHAEQMPLLSIPDVQIDPLADDLYRIWVSVENRRLIPTRTEQDARNHISPPDVVSLTGPNLKVLSAGRVTDRFFKRVDPVKRRPERVELGAIDGMSIARVQFIVTGAGNFTVTVDSAKGGIIIREENLPE